MPRTTFTPDPNQDDITLAEWLKEQVVFLGMFCDNWDEQRIADPQSYPEKMPHEDWDKRLEAFAEEAVDAMLEPLREAGRQHRAALKEE